MKALTPYRESRLIHFWNGKTPVQRLNLILANEDVFLFLELVAEPELKILHATSSSNRDYVLSRETQPFFNQINLLEPFAKQTHAQKLKTALNAVFYKHKNHPSVTSSLEIPLPLYSS